MNLPLERTARLGRASRTARLGRASLCSLLFALLAACGPGTGGTGTGPDQGALFFRATASAASQQPVGEDTGLSVQAQRIEFTTGCSRFVREGGWSLAPSGELLLAGSIETRTASGLATMPGTLRLQFDAADAANATQVLATLRDAADAAVAGPVVLRRGDAAPGATCAFR